MPSPLLRALLPSSPPPSAVPRLLTDAEQAIAARRPRLAFDLLYQAELAHHHPSNTPPPPGEEARLMRAWRSFRAILPASS